MSKKWTKEKRLAFKEFKEITKEELEGHIDFLTDFLYRALKK